MRGPEVGAPAGAASSGAGYGELVLTSLLVLVLVCVVAWVALRLLGKWLEGRRVGTGVTVIGRVPLEPRRSLYVVEAGGRRLLLGSSEGGVTLLTELAADAEPVAAPARAVPAGRGFAEMLAQAVASRVRRRPAALEVVTVAPAEATVTAPAPRDAA
jgi:flagellar protein FliO/FliZ